MCLHLINIIQDEAFHSEIADGRRIHGHVDGVRVGNVQSGQTDLGMMDLNDLSQVVVDYAQNSISFRTARPVFHDKNVAGTAKLGVGSFGTWQPYGKVAVKLNKDWSLSSHVAGIVTNGEFPLTDGAKRINNDSVQYVKVQHGLWEVGRNKLVDRFGFKLRYAYKPNPDYPVVVCVGKKMKAPESWEDEKGKVTTDYQDYLEAEWIKQLRAKYPVEINEKVWESIKK